MIHLDGVPYPQLIPFWSELLEQEKKVVVGDVAACGFVCSHLWSLQLSLQRCLTLHTQNVSTTNTAVPSLAPSVIPPEVSNMHTQQLPTPQPQSQVEISNILIGYAKEVYQPAFAANKTPTAISSPWGKQDTNRNIKSS